MYNSVFLFEKVDADGLFVVFGEDARRETLNHRRFAHAPVADDDDFERDRLVVEHCRRLAPLITLLLKR